MKNVYKQKREQGFTIIEVLIVLAIAALIFLIVFLAVPALNRNSRNNAIKHDAANLLSAVSTYSSNNNGQLPGQVGGSGSGTITIGPNNCSNVAQQSNQVSIQGGTAVTLTCATGQVNAPTATGSVTLAMNHKCSVVNGAQVGVDNNRSIAALFLVETGSSTTATQCVES